MVAVLRWRRGYLRDSAITVYVEQIRSLIIIGASGEQVVVDCSVFGQCRSLSNESATLAARQFRWCLLLLPNETCHQPNDMPLVTILGI